MGCSHSKLDDEEAVQICKDRKRFIKQAIEHRTKFASGHIAYIQSLRKVSDALHDYIEGDNYKPHEFVPSQDSFVTPVKRRPSRRSSSRSGGGEFITISPSSMPPHPAKMIQDKPRSKVKVNYLMANRSRPVRVEQRSPETFRVESFSPPSQQYGEADGFFGMNMNMNMNTSAASSSSFWNPLSSPEQRLSTHNIPPPSPQNSQWDFFWNPFSSLDYYGYSYDRGSVDNRSGMDDEIRGLRRVREEEGIPDLEEDEPNAPEPARFQNHNPKATEESRGKIDKNCCKEEVKVEDVDDDDDEDEDEEDEDDDGEFTDSGCETENEGDEKCVGTQEQRSVEVPRVETTGNVVGVGKVQEMKNVVEVAKRETPGFTVYVNRRPTSMAEVIKDLEDQFTTICDAAKEVSGLLEASRAQYTSSSNEHSGKFMKMVQSFSVCD